MKPEGALTLSVQADLSLCSFEEALSVLNAFPVCTLRVGTQDLATAKLLFDFEGSPVAIILDEAYDKYEWSVEYNGKVLWGQGP